MDTCRSDNKPIAYFTTFYTAAYIRKLSRHYIFYIRTFTLHLSLLRLLISMCHKINPFKRVDKESIEGWIFK